jgi:hypothetical protein
MLARIGLGAFRLLRCVSAHVDKMIRADTSVLYLGTGAQSVLRALGALFKPDLVARYS